MWQSLWQRFHTPAEIILLALAGSFGYSRVTPRILGWLRSMLAYSAHLYGF
jgi:hypothetical protein